MFPVGLSVFASGTTSTNTAATGVTFTGNLATGYTLSRTTGSATGTITEAIENPWSSGQIGQRQSLQFALGSSTVTETWSLQMLNGLYNGYGIQTSELGNGYYYAECELELSGVANLNQLCLNEPYDTTTSWYNYDGNNTVSAAYHLMSSSNEMVAIPNSGKILLRTQPVQCPTYLTNLQCQILFSFNASGGAGSATATVKLNYMAVRKAFTA